MLLNGKLEEMLEKIFPTESETSRTNFTVSLALLLAGELNIEDAAKYSNMSVTHYAFLTDQLNLQNTEYLEEAKEELIKIQEQAPDIDEKPTVKDIPEPPKPEQRLIKTNAFVINGNNVTISNATYNQFWALKASLKAIGGKYNYRGKYWELTDAQMEEWINKQKQFGWFR